MIRALVRHQRQMIIEAKPRLRKQLLAHRKEAQDGLNKLPPCYKTPLEKTEVFMRMYHHLNDRLKDVVLNCRGGLESEQ